MEDLNCLFDIFTEKKINLQIKFSGTSREKQLHQFAHHFSTKVGFKGHMGLFDALKNKIASFETVCKCHNCIFNSLYQSITTQQSKQADKKF